MSSKRPAHLKPSSRVVRHWPPARSARRQAQQLRWSTNVEAGRYSRAPVATPRVTATFQPSMQPSIWMNNPMVTNDYSCHIYAYIYRCVQMNTIVVFWYLLYICQLLEAVRGIWAIDCSFVFKQGINHYWNINVKYCKTGLDALGRHLGVVTIAIRQWLDVLSAALEENTWNQY